MFEDIGVWFNASHLIQGFYWVGQRVDRIVQDPWPELGGGFQVNLEETVV